MARPDALRVLVAMDETKGWNPPPAVRGVHLAIGLALPAGYVRLRRARHRRRKPGWARCV